MVETCIMPYLVRDAIRAAEDILKYARGKGLELKDQLLVSLIDHICFAIERYEQGIDLPYLMLAETRLLYPREFEAGRWALVIVILQTMAIFASGNTKL